MEEIRRTGRLWVAACDALRAVVDEMVGQVLTAQRRQRFLAATAKATATAKEYADATAAAGFPRPNI